MIGGFGKEEPWSGKRLQRQRHSHTPFPPSLKDQLTSSRCMSLAQVTIHRLFRYGDTARGGVVNVVGVATHEGGCGLTVDHDSEEAIVQRLQSREAAGDDLVEHLHTHTYTAQWKHNIITTYYNGTGHLLTATTPYRLYLHVHAYTQYTIT